jgi:hypothetical protein
MTERDKKIAAIDCGAGGGTMAEARIRRFEPRHARTTQGQCSAACVEQEDGPFVTYVDHRTQIVGLAGFLDTARLALADYSRRTMWGSDGDDDVRRAQAAICAALNGLEE